MSKRISRINELIKRELSQIIFKEFEFEKDTFLTLTRVETLSNLAESRIFISVFPEEKEEKIFNFLNQNIYFLQQKLNQRLKMKPIPKIVFLKEKRTKEAAKIEAILEKLKKEKK